MSSIISRWFPCCSGQREDKNTRMIPLYERVLTLMFGEKDINVLMVGKAGAGKTSILHQLGVDNRLTVCTTEGGLVVERVQYRNFHFAVFDVGGKDTDDIKQHFTGVRGLIYVVDSGDLGAIDEAKEQLWGLLRHDDLKDASVLVFANKLDVPGRIDPLKLTDKLGLLGDHTHARTCCVFGGTSVKVHGSGQGHVGGFDEVDRKGKGKGTDDEKAQGHTHSGGTQGHGRRLTGLIPVIINTHGGVDDGSKVEGNDNDMVDNVTQGLVPIIIDTHGGSGDSDELNGRYTDTVDNVARVEGPRHFSGLIPYIINTHGGDGDSEVDGMVRMDMVDNVAKVDGPIDL